MKATTAPAPPANAPALLDAIAASPVWHLIDRWWLLGICAASVILGIFTSPNLLLFSVLVSGVACVALAAKGNILNYIVGIYNSAAYACVSYHDHLYGEVMLNVFFFIPMGVVGFVAWKRHMEKDTKTVIMKGMTTLQALLALAVVALITLTYGIILAHIPKQNTPYIDAFNVVLSIAATLLMVARYKEQWILYIVLNITTVIMWIFRALNHSESAWTMILMWSIFLANACYGYLKWSIGTRRAKAAPATQAQAALAT